MIRPARFARLAVLPILMAGLVAYAPRSETTSPAGRDVTIEIEAGDFAFNPTRIDVAHGDRVTLVLRSNDVVHGLYLEGYDVDLVSDPGRPESATFIADRPGVFRFRCSIPCGPLHPFMTGRLRVGPSPLPVALLVVATAALIGGLVAVIRRTRPAPAPP